MAVGRIAAVLWLAALCSCSETRGRTQVTVRVVAEPEVASEAERLEVTIFGRAADTEDWERVDDVIQVSPAVFPYDVALVPRDDDAMRQFRVDVSALRGGDEVVITDRVSGSYVHEQSLVLELLLEAGCRTIDCVDVSQGCNAGTCVGTFVDPSTYAPYTPPPDGAVIGVDGGMDAGTIDGGVDGGSDAGSDAGNDGGADGGVADGGMCVVGAPLCVGDTLGECGSDGSLVNPSGTCPLGCHLTEARCVQLDPSNGLATLLDRAVSDGMDVIAPSSLALDTDTGAVVADGSRSLSIVSQVVAGTSVDVRVFLVGTFDVGDVSVGGANALAIVAAGDVSTDGTFRLEHTPAGTPGALPAGSACRGGNGNGGVVSGGGGGGGGGAPGARGGNGGPTGGSTGGAGGAVAGPADVVPLVGGCMGGQCNGWGAGGPGGGAVQLVSSTRIDVVGLIQADGGGALAGSGGGGGGGSVLLEAPVVTLSGTGIVANGGGGACRGQRGDDGLLEGGGGGVCTVPGIGNGGKGGWLDAGAQNGRATTTAGGGGGGGTGRIRVNTADGRFVTDRYVSPAPSIGFVGTR